MPNPNDSRIATPAAHNEGPGAPSLRSPHAGKAGRGPAIGVRLPQKGSPARACRRAVLGRAIVCRSHSAPAGPLSVMAVGRALVGVPIGWALVAVPIGRALVIAVPVGRALVAAHPLFAPPVGCPHAAPAGATGRVRIAPVIAVPIRATIVISIRATRVISMLAAVHRVGTGSHAVALATSAHVRWLLL